MEWQWNGKWFEVAGSLEHGSELWTVGWKLCCLDNEIQEGPCWCLSQRAYPGLSASCPTETVREREWDRQWKREKGWDRDILVKTLVFHSKHLWWILKAPVGFRTFMTFLSWATVCQSSLIIQPDIVPSGGGKAPSSQTFKKSRKTRRCGWIFFFFFSNWSISVVDSWRYGRSMWCIAISTVSRLPFANFFP